MSKHDREAARGPVRDPRAEEPTSDAARPSATPPGGLRRPPAVSPGGTKLGVGAWGRAPGQPPAKPSTASFAAGLPPPPPARPPSAKPPPPSPGHPSPGQPSPGPPSSTSPRNSAPPVAAGTPSPSDPFGIVGAQVAEVFLIESAIAHGGFAVVYRAKHLRFSAPVALKCLKIPTNLSPSERAEFLDRFQKEGEVMFRLSSSIPEVVRPLQYDSFKLPGGRLVPFIALEWLEGVTLKDVIVNRLEQGQPPLSLVQAVTFLAPVARALARAHRLPSPEGPLCILHCDLKPDNVFVTELGGIESLRIFDFGISKVRHAATRQVGSSTTDTQASMFTPAYAAPEQWTPDRFGQTGPWTDVFSLALTLTELVTQKPAIDGAPTAMLAQCVNDKSRPTPRRLGLAIPDRIEAIFQRALAVDPRSRYQSIPKFWGDLEEALGLPAVVGEAARRSPSFVGIRADGSSSIPDFGAASAASEASSRAEAPQFAGELDLPLGAPPISPADMPSGITPSAIVGASPHAGSAELAFDLPLAAAPPPTPAQASVSPAQIRAQLPIAPALEVDAPLGAAPSFDLVDDAARPAPAPTAPTMQIPGAPPSYGTPPSMQQGPPSSRAAGQSAMNMPAMRQSSAGMPAVHPGQAGMPPGAPPNHFGAPGGPPAAEPSQPGPATKERLQAVAAKAGQVASVAAVSAASAAKQIANKALEVDERHRIQLDQPATWIKPMLGPIVAMGAALVISIVAVVVNKATGANVSVVWISLPLMLAAIGFAVYRWMKITKE